MNGIVAQAKQLHKSYGETDEDKSNYIEIARIYESKLDEEPQGVSHLLTKDTKCLSNL